MLIPMGIPQGWKLMLWGSSSNGNKCCETLAGTEQNCAGFPWECCSIWLSWCTYSNICWRMSALILPIQTVSCYRLTHLLQSWVRSLSTDCCTIGDGMTVETNLCMDGWRWKWNWMGTDGNGNKMCRHRCGRV